IDYTFTITNTGSPDSPDLIVDTVIDSLTGSIDTGSCAPLAVGASCVLTDTYTVLGTDLPGPVENTVEVSAHAVGFPAATASASDTHSVPLVELTLDKTGPESAPVGSVVTYTFTLHNQGLEVLTLSSIGDTVLGDLGPAATDAGCHVLDADEVCAFTADHTVEALPDPLVNEVSAAYTKDIPDQVFAAAALVPVMAGDSHSLNVFSPSVEIVKSGPAAASVGDEIEYTFTVTNTSSDDTPTLVLDSVDDSILGDLLAAATEGDSSCDEVDPGESCEFTAPYTVLDTDADPLLNDVTVHFHPDGFDDTDVTAAARHIVDLVPADLASLTVVVVGGDPDFELTGPIEESFTLDPTSASITFEDIPNGEYTIDMTALEAGLVLDAIDCDPEETSLNLAQGIIVFDVADAPVTCTYTLSAEDDDDYNQYPGDNDFDFDTPFDNDDDTDDPQAPAQVAGDNQTNNPGSGSNDPGLGGAGDPGFPAPAGDIAPQAVDQLPRTGTALAQLGLMSGLLMILFGLAALLGARRRQATEA
ncbi:MAG: DUF7507 domain-containing protein, partial [Acidimicrobiia bacterium]